MMKYQLVIQFPEELYSDLDWIADLEDQLDESFVDAEVDGHDIGSGEVNIFIHATDPVNTFSNSKKYFKRRTEWILKNIKVAYREIGRDAYIPLWPVKI